jgi:RNA polymerase sigma factor (sigma-70 family)
MGKGREHGVFRQLRTLFDFGAVGTLTDEELVGRFEAGPREVAELAFAVLVERHGPMVLRSCRRILGDEHDAQDAFQATFLVLARKGRSVRRREAIGAWLHGVACRVAASARATSARRRKHERAAAQRAELVEGPASTEDIAPAIHEEIERLPERYRVPIVLCCLEGLTREQAALRLGWRVGTVQSRLARGRERLRVRLARRGIAPALGALTAALARETQAAGAGISTHLCEATTAFALEFAAGPSAAGTVPAAVAALSTGVLNAMVVQKIKLLAAAAVCLALVGVGITRGQAPADAPKGVSGDFTQLPKGAPDRLGDLERKLDRVLEALGQSPPGPQITGASRDDLAGRTEEHVQNLAEDAKAKLEWAERMFTRGYVSEAQLRAYRLDLEAAKLRLDRLRAAHGGLEQTKSAAPPPALADPRVDLTASTRIESSRIERLERRLDELAQRVEALERRQGGGEFRNSGQVPKTPSPASEAPK